MNYGAWTRQHLTQVTIKNDNRLVSLWCSDPSDKPLLLLVSRQGRDTFVTVKPANG